MEDLLCDESICPPNERLFQLITPVKSVLLVRLLAAGPPASRGKRQNSRRALYNATQALEGIRIRNVRFGTAINHVNYITDFWTD